MAEVRCEIAQEGAESRPAIAAASPEARLDKAACG